MATEFEVYDNWLRSKMAAQAAGQETTREMMEKPAGYDEWKTGKVLLTPKEILEFNELSKEYITLTAQTNPEFVTKFSESVKQTDPETQKAVLTRSTLESLYPQAVYDPKKGVEQIYEYSEKANTFSTDEAGKPISSMGESLLDPGEKIRIDLMTDPNVQSIRPLSQGASRVIYKDGTTKDLGEDQGGMYLYTLSPDLVSYKASAGETDTYTYADGTSVDALSPRSEKGSSNLFNKIGEGALNVGRAVYPAAMVVIGTALGGVPGAAFAGAMGGLVKTGTPQGMVIGGVAGAAGAFAAPFIKDAVGSAFGSLTGEAATVFSPEELALGGNFVNMAGEGALGIGGAGSNLTAQTMGNALLDVGKGAVTDQLFDTAQDTIMDSAVDTIKTAGPGASVTDAAADAAAGYGSGTNALAAGGSTVGGGTALGSLANFTKGMSFMDWIKVAAVSSPIVGNIYKAFVAGQISEDQAKTAVANSQNTITAYQTLQERLDKIYSDAAKVQMDAQSGKAPYTESAKIQSDAIKEASALKSTMSKIIADQQAASVGTAGQQVADSLTRSAALNANAIVSAYSGQADAAMQGAQLQADTATMNWQQQGASILETAAQQASEIAAAAQGQSAEVQRAAQIRADSILQAASLQADTAVQSGGVRTDAENKAWQTQKAAILEGAQALVEAAGQNIGTFQKAYDTTSGLFAPFTELGAKGTNALLSDAYKESPYYNYLVAETLKAQERSSAARTGTLNPRAVIALEQKAKDLASLEYNNWLQQQYNLANYGINAAGSMTGAANTLAQNVAGQTTVGAGALASGLVGGANAEAAGVRAAAGFTAEALDRYTAFRAQGLTQSAAATAAGVEASAALEAAAQQRAADLAAAAAREAAAVKAAGQTAAAGFTAGGLNTAAAFNAAGTKEAASVLGAGDVSGSKAITDANVAAAALRAGGQTTALNADVAGISGVADVTATGVNRAYEADKAAEIERARIAADLAKSRGIVESNVLLGIAGAQNTAASNVANANAYGAGQQANAVGNTLTGVTNAILTYDYLNRI